MINNSDLKFSNASSNSTSSDLDKISISTAVIKPATAEINVNYYGFSEEGKNAKEAEQAKQAQQAFEYAATIWEGWIKSSVAIEVDAHWQDLSRYGSGVLAAASPFGYRRNFAGATQEDIKYGMPLANHLAGEDLNGDRSEIETEFNSKFGKWYFGTDGNTPKNQYDFVTVALHELVHGFGLTDYIRYNDQNDKEKENDTARYGASIFESFIVNSDNQSLNTFANDSKEFVKQLTSNKLFFNGANATAANGGEKIKLYAPSKWEYGSSVAHLDEKTYPKGDAASLMTPFVNKGEAIHNPGAITLGILEDLGWDINKADSQSVSPQASAPVEEPAPTQPVEAPIIPPVETPLTQASVIKIEQDKLTSYAGQDKKSDFTISDNNQEIEITGNGWKKLALDYQITDKTILEFEFLSEIQGEIQGIGFDTDDKFGSKSDKKLFFQLEGTQKAGVSKFKDNVTGKGWKTYQITVGDYLTGDFNYLTFVNDHDVSNADAKSKYRNLRLYEEGQQFAPVETPIIPLLEAPFVPPLETPFVPPLEAPFVPPLETPFVPPLETPSTQASVIKIEEDKLTSYAGQDKKSDFTISNNNQQIEIQGNGWKKLALDYQITDKTILEFEFLSEIQGEIQGIGFDTDDKFGSKSDKKIFFQLEGKDKLGVRDFKQDITGFGWKTYQITVGDYLTGDFNYLTFVNDHDKGDKNAASKYRNLRLYEESQQFIPTETPLVPPVETPITPPVETPLVPPVEALITPPVETPLVPPEETPSTQASVIKIEEDKLTSYARQDKESSFTISDNNQQIEIQGNGWKKLALDYQITDKTFLEFEFSSEIQGEIQGIGFDTDDKFGSKSDKKLLFQLEGSQKAGVSKFKDNVTGQGWKTYQITVGDYYKGNFNYLTFVNDHDVSNADATSKYRNIKLYEGDANKFSKANTDNNSDVVLTVKDSTNNYNLSSYGGENQDEGTSTISDDKTEVKLEGNTWSKLDINNYNITENTVLKFDFKTTAFSEIQGIGFDNDDFISNSDRTNLFKVSGTQDWGIELEDSYTLGSGWQSYEVKVGDYFTGEFNYLTLANDDDTYNSAAQTQFRNISLSEM